MNSKEVFWCKNCLNMSTRPRITFDERGWCNACQWSETKKTLDWSPRQNELAELVQSCKDTNSNFDCIVPVSGGKDGSYVAHTLKHKHGLNPLTVTVRPALALDIGDKNLFNFIQSGFDHVHVSPNVKVMDRLNKYGFIEKGFPYYGWLIAIMTGVIQVAVKFNIPMVFYSENGEIEYGGSTETKNRATYDIEFMKRVFLEGGHEKVFNMALADDDISEQELSWFKFPTDEEVEKANLSFAHMSYFEGWDSYRNYVVAKEHCGLVEQEDTNAGTFTNFSQNDQALYSLHAYMMYLKFGFGRATQDAGIEIRRGSMTREQAVNLVNLYDNSYPYDNIELYLDYYGMTKEEFDAVLDKYANTNLFEKIDGIWEPKFEIDQND